MLESVTFWLSAAAVLVAYLCVSVGLRWRREEAERRSRESHEPGKAFNVAAIAPRIQRVRQNPLAALHAQPRHDCCRTRLLAAARQMITHLAFFSREGTEHGTQSRKA